MFFNKGVSILIWREPYELYGGQMAERLGNRAINLKVAGSIPGCC